MAVLKTPTLVFGNSLAALVCTERLRSLGKEVVLLSPSNFLGGHFHGLDIDGVHFDIGMNLLEFTSYNSDPNASLDTFNPMVKNDSGRFVHHIQKYINEELGTKTCEVDTPLMSFSNLWLEDFLIADNLESLKKLPGDLQDKIVSELENINSGELHPRNKNSSVAFANATLAMVSKANHGEVFHNIFIEPICRKITNYTSEKLMGYYHRLTWMPVFYPETLTSFFTENPQEITGVKFSYPTSGQMDGPILTIREKIEDSLKIDPIVSGGLKYEHSLFHLELQSGQKIECKNLVWASDWTQFYQSIGQIVPKMDGANVTCGFFQVDSENLLKKFSAAFVIDSQNPIYRVSQFDSCGAAEKPLQRICVEMNTDYCESIGAQVTEASDVWGLLGKLDVVKGEFKSGKLKNFKGALLLATPENFENFKKSQQNFENLKWPLIPIGAASGFSTTSFNDQVVQGLATAQKLAGET